MIESSASTSPIEHMPSTDSERIWLSSPHLGEEELSFILQALESNWIAPHGPLLDQFEQRIATYSGTTGAAALVSCTAAIHLSLILMGVERGDHVMCQSFTFVGSCNPIRYLDAVPVFVDSEPDTWNMDPELLREGIDASIRQGRRPKAVIAVNLYGMPAKLEQIRAVCGAYEIPLIEDAAESFGSSIEGRPTGSFGQVGVFSFNGNKIITTSGGGAVVANDPRLLEEVRFLATQARDAAPHYEHSRIGYNYRMSNVLAGIGLGQLAMLDDRIAQRRANFERYRTYFEQWNHQGFDVRFQVEPEGFSSNRWITAMVMDPEANGGLSCEEIRLALAADNIESRPLWKPMHLQPVYRDAPHVGGGVCDRLFEHGLCLPSGSNLTEAQFARIFNVLDGVFEGCRKKRALAYRT